jgi:hypothetical protein
METNGRKLAATQLLDAINGLDKQQVKEYVHVMLRYVVMMAPEYAFPYNKEDLVFWFKAIKNETKE